MSYYDLKEFIYICRSAGFDNPAEVWQYMNYYRLTCKKFADTLDALIFGAFAKI